MLVDSHCHLDYYSADELPGVLERAAAAGVREIVTIGTRLAQGPELIALAEAHPQVWCTVGIHPHHAGEEPVPSPETVAALADHPRVVGIGESGLDYFYDRSPRSVQQAGFRAHIRAARLAGLPLVIHARDADEDIAAILADERDQGGGFDFVLHCFSSGRALAEAAIAMGGFVSFSGILTFPKSTQSARSHAIFPPTVCSWKPTRRISHRSRSAATQRAGLDGAYGKGAGASPGAERGGVG